MYEVILETKLLENSVGISEILGGMNRFYIQFQMIILLNCVCVHVYVYSFNHLR